MSARWYDAWPDQLPSPTQRWVTPEFRKELTAWVRGAVGPIRSMTQVKLRPWATVWHVEAGDGRFYAKQNCALQAFEARLMADLASWAGDLVVPVVAVEPERDLLLTRDQGAVLAETTAPGDLETWTRVVVAAAELQRAVAGRVAELEQHGMTVLAAPDAAAYVTARVAQTSGLTDSRHLPGDAAAAILRELPAIQGWAEDVAALGLPLTVEHGDLHANNVFDTPSGLRFFDYADALVSDPLGALRVPLDVLALELSAGREDARLRRLADAYLEVWSDLAPMSELRRVLPAALRIGRLVRVESWARVTASMSPEELPDWGEAVPGWLRRIADPAPVGWGS